MEIWKTGYPVSRVKPDIKKEKEMWEKGKKNVIFTTLCFL
jgi:hypothetical protein